MSKIRPSALNDAISFDSIESFEQEWRPSQGEIEFLVKGAVPVSGYWINNGSSTTLVHFVSSPGGFFSVPTWPLSTWSQHDKSINILLIFDNALAMTPEANITLFAGTDHDLSYRDKLIRIIGKVAGADKLVLFGEASAAWAALSIARQVSPDSVIAVDPIFDANNPPAYKHVINRLWDESVPFETDLFGQYSSPVSYQMVLVENRSENSSANREFQRFVNMLPLITPVVALSRSFGPEDSWFSTDSIRSLIDAVVNESTLDGLSSKIRSVDFHVTVQRESAKITRPPLRKMEAIGSTELGCLRANDSLSIQLISDKGLHPKDIALLFKFIDENGRRLADDALGLSWSPGLDSYFDYNASAQANQLSSSADVAVPFDASAAFIKVVRWDMDDDFDPSIRIVVSLQRTI